MPTINPVVSTVECACGCGRIVDQRRWYKAFFFKGHSRTVPYVVPFQIEDHGYKTPCWIWKRYKNSAGYGRYQRHNAHRVFYSVVIGSIPPGYQLDHLCRVPSCVNPNHLQPITNRENTLRGLAPSLNRERMRSMTHCKHGHPLSGDNLFVRKNGKRECRACMRSRNNKHRAAARLEAASKER